MNIKRNNRSTLLPFSEFFVSENVSGGDEHRALEVTTAKHLVENVMRNAMQYFVYGLRT